MKVGFGYIAQPTDESFFNEIGAGELGEALQYIFGSKFEQYDSEELGLAVLYKYPEFRKLSYSWYAPLMLTIDDESFYLAFGLAGGLAGIGVFGPNFIYRTLLFIFTNNSWKKNE